MVEGVVWLTVSIAGAMLLYILAELLNEYDWRPYKDGEAGQAEESKSDSEVP